VYVVPLGVPPQVVAPQLVKVEYPVAVALHVTSVPAVAPETGQLKPVFVPDPVPDVEAVTLYVGLLPDREVQKPYSKSASTFQLLPHRIADQSRFTDVWGSAL
jgi:hypothetical protein